MNAEEKVAVAMECAGLVCGLCRSGGHYDARDGTHGTMRKQPCPAKEIRKRYMPPRPASPAVDDETIELLMRLSGNKATAGQAKEAWIAGGGDIEKAKRIVKRGAA